jgi:general secretion pathway protein H
LPHRRYASEADGRWISLPADLSVSVTTARGAAGANLARVAFFPDGSSTGGHVFLRRDDLSYDVAVDWLTGQTSVEAAQ